MLKRRLDQSDWSFEDIEIGQSASFEFKVEAKDVEDFARLSGDFSSLHMDEQFARRTRYRERVAHGMLVCAPVSALIGMCLPGKNGILLAQQVRFVGPVGIGDDLIVQGEVKSKSPATNAVVVLFTISHKRTEKVVARGEAQILVASPPKKGLSMDTIKDMNLRMDFSEKVILVTGASRGIGEATAKLFAYHGARVIVTYFRGMDDAERIVQEIRSGGAEAVAIRADIRVRADVNRMVQSGIEHFGRVDVLVNNAVGRAEPLEFNALAWEDLKSDLEVVVGGAFNCSQAILPLMLKNGGGRIINITTVYTGSPPAKYCSYVTAKSALLGLTRSLAVEYGPKGILVNAVSPGVTDTDLISYVPEHVKETMRSKVPLGRLADPIDIAKAVLFLASRYADYINGHQLVVAGGSFLA